MRNVILSLLLLTNLLLSSSFLVNCRTQTGKTITNSREPILEKPSEENQDEYVPYTGTFEELKENEKKENIVIWEQNDQLWVRYGTKDYPIQKVKLHQYLFSENRLFDSNSLTFAGIQDNKATICKVGPFLFSRIFPVSEEIPVLMKGAVENTLQTNQDAAKKRTFQTFPLVSPVTLRPSIQKAMRLTSKNNPIKQTLLNMNNPFLSAPAAEALAKVEDALQTKGLSLVIYQAYLPWYAEQTYLQLMQAMQIEKQEWEAYQKNLFSSGYTLHVGLFNQKAQQYVDMGSAYLDLIEESNLDYFGGTSLQRYYKQLLSSLMKKHGFTPYSSNWWGYTFQTKQILQPSNQNVQEETTKK